MIPWSVLIILLILLLVEQVGFKAYFPGTLPLFDIIELDEMKKEFIFFSTVTRHLPIKFN